MSATTIILPVSRPHFLDRVFTHLEFLKCDRERTNLVTYVDGNHQLYTKARNLTMNSKFAGRLCQYRAKGLTSTGSVRRRRKRIAEIHNEIRWLIKPVEHLLLLEDDTLFPNNTLTKLTSGLLSKRYSGIVSGIELGRWGFKHIGAWKFDDVYDPTRITSPPLEEGIKEIDATGLYCCMTRFDDYMSHKFEPFLDVMGPDVNFGIDLRKNGKKNYIDNDIKCTHLTLKNEITINNSEVVQVVLEKDDESRFGWRTTTI